MLGGQNEDRSTQKCTSFMPKGITGHSVGSSFLSSTILTSWTVSVCVMRPSNHCEVAQHPWVARHGQPASLRLLTKDLLSKQTRSNMEIIKLSMYVYVVDCYI